jgi:ribosomal protein S18 acetylase RimI-like enzyme
MSAMSNRGRFGKYGELKRLERLKARPLPHHGEKITHLETGKRFPSGSKAFGRVKIRRASEGDASFIRSLSRTVFSKYGPYDDILGSFFHEAGGACLIAEAGGRRCGFLILGRPFRDADKGEVEIVALAVSPKMHRRGIASALLVKAEEILRGAGISQVLIHTGLDNEPALAFFNARGFTPLEIRPSFYPMGQSAKAMKKTLR